MASFYAYFIAILSNFFMWDMLPHQYVVNFLQENHNYMLVMNTLGHVTLERSSV